MEERPTPGFGWWIARVVAWATVSVVVLGAGVPALFWFLTEGTLERPEEPAIVFFLFLLALVPWAFVSAIAAKLVYEREYGGGATDLFAGGSGSALELLLPVVYVWFYPLAVAWTIKDGLGEVAAARNPGVAGVSVASWLFLGLAGALYVVLLV